MKKTFTFFAISALFLMLLFPVSVKADTTLSFIFETPNGSGPDEDCNGNTIDDWNAITTSDFHFSSKLYDEVKQQSSYLDKSWTSFEAGAKACTRHDVHLEAGSYTFTLKTTWMYGNNNTRVPIIRVNSQDYSLNNVNYLSNEEVDLEYTVSIPSTNDYPILITCVDGDKDKFCMRTLTITPNCTQHSVTVAADDNDKGTVAGGGSYCENSEVTVTATPNPGYNFVNWTDNNNSNAVVSTNASHTFTLTANVNYRANFAACEGAAVTVNRNNNDYGTVTGEGSYCAGSQVNLTATPNSGYRFVNWTVTSGSASLDDARSETTHFVMSDPATAVTIRANFEEDIKADRTYTYRAVEDNTGHNTNAGESTDEYLFIGADGQYIDFTHYSAVATTCTIKVGFYAPWDGKEFKVYVNDGQEKANWTWNTTEGERDMGEFNLSAGYNKITVAASWNWYGIRYIKVIVEESKYVVTVVNNDTYGTVTAASSNFAGEVVNISVDANPGYFFSGWASDDVTFDNASATSTTFEMPSSDVTITANYTTCTQHTVTLAANNGSYGSVDGGGLQCEGSVTVTATPNSSYRFVNWTITSTSEAVSTDAKYTFDLSADISLTANFAVEICSNNLTIQCEEGTYQINSALLTNGKSIPDYKIANNWYSGADGNYVDFNHHEGEIYYIIDLPAATYSFTVYKAHAGDSWLNIWEAGLGNALTYDGVDYGKHHDEGYDIRGDNEGYQDKPIHNSTISNVTLSAGTYIIGLYGNDYAVYDKIVITANSNVFCPTYDITMVNNMGGAAPTADKVKAEENASVSISAAATIGEFSFTGWTASPEVTFADASVANTTFTMPAEAVTITANYNTYSRTGAPIAAGNYGTICLPLNGTVTGATLYSVAGKETGDINYLVLEDKGNSLEAGKPYIFQLYADELSVALDGTYTDLQLGNGLVGTYETINLTPYAEPSTLNYFLYANAFKKAGNNVTVGAYRAYLNWDAVNAAPAQAPSARRIRMVIEGQEVETGMETVTAMPKTTKVLIDGQLFIIREGKRYTLTGARAQ